MKNAFKFPMLKYERVLGCVYIPIHVLLPTLIMMVLGTLNMSFRPVYIMLIWYTLSFVIVLIIAFRFLRKSFSDMLDGFIRVVQSVILGYALYFVMLLAVSLLLSYAASGLSNPNTTEVLDMFRQNRVIMTVVSVVLAPIIEETLFRGALFGSLRQKSRILAYIVSALLFAAYHLWQYAALDFSWGLLLLSLQYITPAVALAWCYEHSGTIWAPILMHMAVNFISTRAA